MNKNYKPLPSFLTIDKSSIDGHGIFAKDEIEPYTFLGVIRVHHPNSVDGYIRTPLGGFVNHSNTPNCDIEDHGEFVYMVTTKTIKQGEELTLKYTLYDPTR